MLLLHEFEYSITALLSVDTMTLKDSKLETEPGQKSNGVFPLAWYHEFDGGAGVLHGARPQDRMLLEPGFPEAHPGRHPMGLG